MPELIAQGILPSHRWRHSLPSGQSVELGRATRTFSVPWDNRISRRHVQMTLHDDRVNVVKLDSAANPVFHNGAQEDVFWLNSGEHFVIGETTFTLTFDRAEATLDVPMPVSQQTFSHDFLERVKYRDADRRIEVLSRLLDLISSATEESELLTRIVNTLMEGIPGAASIGIVQCDQANQSNADDIGLNVLHWDRRGTGSGDFAPSARLIGEADSTGETVLHIWHVSQRKSDSKDAAYTFDYENDWAFCCPLENPATAGWAIYVAGANRPAAVSGASDSDLARSFDTGSGAMDLQGDIKFCELVGSTLKNLLQVKQLDRRQASFRGFFSPVVLHAIAQQDPEEVLAPRECDVSVLFCDLRGFSQKSEQLAGDLSDLLNRVSDALGVMTHNILGNGGVIGDFHGDAAMGFWGWPLEDQGSAAQAVLAARGIRDAFAEFANDPTHPLSDFQVGIGIATGRAVAGKIGSRDQVKVTAFGPVVNLASRLEGMTRWLGAEILVDDVTARQAVVRPPIDGVAKMADDDQGQERSTPAAFQLLGNFQPYGLSNSLNVHALLDVPPIDGTSGTADSNERYAKALRAFEAGDWIRAIEELNSMPRNDRARIFLESYISRHNDEAPDGWDGVIRMIAK
jgi:adenylate cyclase